MLAHSGYLRSRKKTFISAMQLSPRLQRFSEPETLKMAKLGRELRAKGYDITDLSLGEPDMDTPDHIKDAVIQAVKDNFSHYTPVSGYVDVREAACYKFKRDNNVEYKPENIVISTGAKQSITNCVFATTDAGDEVVIPTPYWVSYSEIVRLGGATPVLVRTKAENKFKITPEELEAAITPDTKLFMFSSPNNPTGSVYTQAELEGLAEVFRRHPQVYIMSDEIYEHITYVGKVYSIAQIEDLKDRVIIINGLSKAYAMTGYRLGIMAANADVAKACDKLQGQFTSGTSAVTQRAAIVALRDDLSATKAMVEEFTRRRDFVFEQVKEIPGFKLVEPDGAFYIFPDVSSYYGKSDGETTIKGAGDLCMYLLEKGHVSTVSGDAFGEPNCVRMSFAASMPNLIKGWQKIKDALAKLS